MKMETENELRNIAELQDFHSQKRRIAYALGMPTCPLPHWTLEKSNVSNYYNIRLFGTNVGYIVYDQCTTGIPHWSLCLRLNEVYKSNAIRQIWTGALTLTEVLLRIRQELTAVMEL